MQAASVSGIGREGQVGLFGLWRWLGPLSLVVALSCSAFTLATDSPLFSRYAWQLDLPPEPAMPLPARQGFATVGDFKMAYAIYGAGSPVLLIHGGLGNAEQWAAVVGPLAAHHQVIVADTRGHGRSERGSAPMTYDQLADDYLGLLDSLHLSKVALVGWSDGGIIGLDIAMHHPERLQSLVTYGANSRADALVKPVINPVMVEIGQRSEEDFIADGAGPAAWQRLTHDVQRMWDTEPSWTSADLARIRTRTLIADGQYEEFIDPDDTRSMAAAIPGARLELLPDTGHFAPLQTPAAFSRMVLAFLDQGDDPAGP
ncbi:Pimeloyl-ACP methyl ester carboxylesterase [Arboricoccus pini]|uniref:Pimeloyl-ACP methyl ester carboxylesterase n=1 Tax=Arboricoccus pini TaxID=1963835 RepID=A0A212RMR0_9PROT|nr:alpha/beta hydrolase [Arboricoccus pini]SNB73817.1 Pimeloyl-ACP methyl ester carboxylesterase [Arboricoccus pini]